MSGFGTDLSVLPGLSATGADRIDLRPRRRPVRGPLPPGAQEALDLSTIAGRENLAQALILRLITPRGALAALGHATYGSRLHELVGRNKSEALRLLCRAHVLEALAQEPRILPRALAVIFDPQQETPSSFVFRLDVQPRNDTAPLSLFLEAVL
ncbi:hypothetical protein J8J14_13760 [Roseomonas sp. SSH11]|uniref:IraD/Gp25-like domain-containing protein n=1 Tax=Pararoseomonas baculiformis TaxID=2820812 RepID=A0ABS4AG42_9PROT|nr:hypothetical protein [Pararoseomonas baculiformis]MBP0445841.1 hypothetical protein [Pararoseomonas baculiformis]